MMIGDFNQRIACQRRADITNHSLGLFAKIGNSPKKITLAFVCQPRGYPGRWLPMIWIGLRPSPGGEWMAAVVAAQKIPNAFERYWAPMRPMTISCFRRTSMAIRRHQIRPRKTLVEERPIGSVERCNYTVKLQHIADALIASGYTSLDKQAKALGINRSTTWTIVKAKHKLGRLSAKTSRRILANPELPAAVRTVVERYLTERLATSSFLRDN